MEEWTGVIIFLALSGGLGAGIYWLIRYVVMDYLNQLGERDRIRRKYWPDDRDHDGGTK